MNLDVLLQEKLAKWQPPAGRQNLALPDTDGWGVSLTVDRNDVVGSLVWELSLRRTAATPDSDAAALKGWATRIADRVTGLLEGLHVVEVDAQRNEAILRSDKPTSRGDERLYYEVRLQGTSVASVRRYRGQMTGAQREQVAFALTHEALGKLAQDIVSA